MFILHDIWMHFKTDIKFTFFPGKFGPELVKLLVPYLMGIRRTVVANLLEYNIVVSEFELPSRCNVHFRTNTLRKSINFLISPDIG